MVTTRRVPITDAKWFFFNRFFAEATQLEKLLERGTIYRFRSALIFFFGLLFNQSDRKFSTLITLPALWVRHVKNDMTKLLLDQSLSSPKYALIYFSRAYDWLSPKKRNNALVVQCFCLGLD